jgi:hypothetical protein
LSIGRATRCGLLLGSLPALILHLAAIEAHVRIVSEAGRESIGEETRIAVNVAKPGDPITLSCQKLTHL